MNRNIYVATKAFSIRRYLFVVLSDKGLKLKDAMPVIEFLSARLLSVHEVIASAICKS